MNFFSKNYFFILLKGFFNKVGGRKISRLNLTLNKTAGYHQHIFLFQSHSTANLLQFGIKNVRVQKLERTSPTCVNAIGQHRIKKTFHLREGFSFHIL